MTMCTLDEIGQFSLNFNMFHYFRINITIHHFQVFTVGGNCLKDYFNIAPDNITLCGIHSFVQLYPKDKTISLTIGFDNGIYFDILTTFVVISRGIITSKLALHSSYQQQKNPHLSSVYSLIMIKLLVETYKIQVWKYQGISLEMKITNSNVKYLLFPGPGFSHTRKRILSRTGTCFIQNFQCSLQIIHSMDFYNNNSFHVNMSFKGKVLPMKSIEVEYTILFTFPGSDCNIVKNVCILMVNTIKSSYINFTILTFTFEGFPNSKCEYGGVSLQNYKGSSFHESYVLCNRFNYTSQYRHFKLQSIYSNNSKLLIVIYHYGKYSSLAIKAYVSKITCSGVMVDICSLNLMKYQTKIILNTLFLQLVHDASKISDLTLNILAKSCFILQIYSNQVNSFMFSNVVKLKFFGCPLYLRVGLSPSFPVSWKVRARGFLQSNSVYSHKLSVYGEFYFDKSEIGIKWENGTQHSLGSKERERQHWFLAPNNKDILFHMQFVMKTPAHKNFMYFKISVYHWSYSWINFLINSTDTAPSKTKIESLLIEKYTPKYLQVVPKETAVLLLSIKAKHEHAVKVRALTFPQQNLCKEYTQFSTIYQSQEKSSNLLLALPGIINIVSLSAVLAQKSVEAIASTTWIYTKHIISTANKEVYGLKFPKYPFRRRHYIIKHARKGTYHFIKWYKEECFSFGKKSCKMDQMFWSHAAGICKYAEAVLPQFFSRTDQDELISIIKQSTDLFPIEALFIGLRTKHRPR